MNTKNNSLTCLDKDDIESIISAPSLEGIDDNSLCKIFQGFYENRIFYNCTFWFSCALRVIKASHETLVNKSSRFVKEKLREKNLGIIGMLKNFDPLEICFKNLMVDFYCDKKKEIFDALWDNKHKLEGLVEFLTVCAFHRESFDNSFADFCIHSMINSGHVLEYISKLCRVFKEFSDVVSGIKESNELIYRVFNTLNLFLRIGPNSIYCHFKRMYGSIEWITLESFFLINKPVLTYTSSRDRDDPKDILGYMYVPDSIHSEEQFFLSCRVGTLPRHVLYCEYTTSEEMFSKSKNFLCFLKRATQKDNKIVKDFFEKTKKGIDLAYDCITVDCKTFGIVFVNTEMKKVDHKCTYPRLKESLKLTGFSPLGPYQYTLELVLENMSLYLDSPKKTLKLRTGKYEAYWYPYL